MGGFVYLQLTISPCSLSYSSVRRKYNRGHIFDTALCLFRHQLAVLAAMLALQRDMLSLPLGKRRHYETDHVIKFSAVYNTKLLN
jgi:hypothetical protein